MSIARKSAASRNSAGRPADAPKPKASRRYGGKTSEQRCAERRMLLVEAAQQLVGTKGYYAATVRAICKQAGLSERYFYESFATREEILSEVYDAVILGARKAVLEAIAQVPAEQIAEVAVGPDSHHPLVDAAIRAFFEYLTAEPHRASIAVIDAVSLSTNRDGMSIAATTSFSDLIVELGEAILGTEHPLLRPCAVGMVGYLSRILSYWTVSGGKPSRERIIDAALATCQGTINYLLHTTQAAAGDHYPLIESPSELAHAIGFERRRAAV